MSNKEQLKTEYEIYLEKLSDKLYAKSFLYKGSPLVEEQFQVINTNDALMIFADALHSYTASRDREVVAEERERVQKILEAAEHTSQYGTISFKTLKEALIPHVTTE